MGVLLDLLKKFKPWISTGASDSSSSSSSRFFPEYQIMSSSGFKICCQCRTMSSESSSGYRCQSCGSWSCSQCLKGYGYSTAAVESNEMKCDVDVGESLKLCKFCDGVRVKPDGGKKNREKVHPVESPRASPEPPSPSASDSVASDHLAEYLESRDCALINKSMTCYSAQPSPVSLRSTSRSDEDEAEDLRKHFHSPSSEFYHDSSDIECNSDSSRLEFYNCKSVGSSPLHSPSRISFTSDRIGHPVQKWQGGSPLSRSSSPFDPETMAVLGTPRKGIQDSENSNNYHDNLTTLQNQYEKSQKFLEFESNGLLWFPPPPEDENDEAETNFFTYDDDEDDVGDSAAMFSSSSSLSSFPMKDKQNEGNKEPLRAVIQGHFRALVSQLLQGENLRHCNEDGSEEWLDVVTNIAWQAASFVKPDTSKGGSMDPGDYVKVKCIASSRPMDSTLVKGVVCTKNIKHKRMTTQYKNARLLLLGGALEYQSVVNPLASFETLVQQEKDHLKMIISKIEALRPNVLLVERSVSPYAQEYLLAKDISLVLNVRKPLLERIARCTGALISPSIDGISTTRCGHCELFRVERVLEELEDANQLNKKPSKTLMYFEGCPRRLGCTVILKGANREELKKVKHVVQYAIFAAHHLSLETSFLADEGATLPEATAKHAIAIPEKIMSDSSVSAVPLADIHAVVDRSAPDDASVDAKQEQPGSEFLSALLDDCGISTLSIGFSDDALESTLFDTYYGESQSNMRLGTRSLKDLKTSTLISHSGVGSLSVLDEKDFMAQEMTQLGEAHEIAKVEKIDENEVSSEYFSPADTNQSILVSFSSRSVLKGAVCERSRLLRIKFYGSFDKPLGRYLRDDLFDQTSYCRSCNDPAEAHVLCYTHQQGNLTINVRSLSSMKLPGEKDGKIWMWHRCLRCAHVDGVPPATRRVVMSDAAWGLSFGKFLELSFSNHATANRVAPCGHSLQRDCLRFYGFGSTVAFFRYSPIDILNVHLPPSMLEFMDNIQHDWIRKEASELLATIEAFYGELSETLDRMEQRSKSAESDPSNSNELLNHIMELKDQLCEERGDYNTMLQPTTVDCPEPGEMIVDILELNRLRRALMIASHVWDRQLYSLDSLLKTNTVIMAKELDASHIPLKELADSNDVKFDQGHDEKASSFSVGLKSELDEVNSSLRLVHDDPTLISSHNTQDELHLEGYNATNRKLFDEFSGNNSSLSDRIDSIWTGTYHQLTSNVQSPRVSQVDGCQDGSINLGDNPPLRRLKAPARVHSFDSALRVQERIRKGLLPSSSHFSTLRSFHASGDFRSMLRDPVSNTLRTYSQMLPLEAQKSDVISSSLSSISSASHICGGARLLLPQRGQNDIVIGVYDDDPASIVSYALSSKEYEDWIENDGIGSVNEQRREESGTFSAWQSFGSLDLDFIRHGSYGSEDTLIMGTLSTDAKGSPHLTISYGDDSPAAGGKVKFSVTCYFAKQFESLRKRCCPSEVDFIRSLSRCHRWSAQGGKSNVYFARSLDERFIIKQVKKTELESFEEFAPEYFKYLTDSLKSGSPTCLAKILGIYQVSVKHLKGGKEVKMDLMVMENLFYRRNVTRVYDLKGSARSRYNPDTSGRDKVLLDMNLVESLRTEPIFLGSKAKRSLERAIWNDTSFLASADVMDYSLLVGVDEERKELVLGIIDFMRQYTWDKHLETWVKASGILGGPKNASPTIISPKQYKKRFRKAMTSYFLTVPDQWSS